MSRYQRQLRLSMPKEQVEPIIENFLLQNRFYQGQWQGEDCWIADQPPAKQVRFFRYDYDGKTLRFSAWLREGKQGETGLDGLAALDLKAPYHRALVLLCRQLLEASPEKNNIPDWMKQDNGKTKRQWVIFVLALLVAGALIAFSLEDYFPSAH